ncbi:MAG: alpha/beta fold hydrolase [Ignavibacteriae bacterium]|nr:alpha/beta fold hydrolase [Ignavibacteriota bacterium]
MTILVVLIIIFVLFLLGAALIILVIAPLILLQPERRTREWYARRSSLLEPRDANLPQEDVTISTKDGIALSAWLVKQQSSARGTILYLHGVGDAKIGGIAHARLWFNNGYNVVLYDSRQHGGSGGHYCTYGYYEKQDVSTVIDYLLERKDIQAGNIGIFGTSMGAAIALQAAAIDARIKAVVAEASFTDLRTISVDYQRRIVKLPWHFLRNFAMTRSQKIARFKARDVSPLEDVKRLSTPVLFIHGTNDEFIRVEYSKTLYEHAYGPKDLLIIEGANHNDIWEVGGNIYERKIIGFFDQHLH